MVNRQDWFPGLQENPPRIDAGQRPGKALLGALSCLFRGYGVPSAPDTVQGGGAHLRGGRCGIDGPDPANVFGVQTRTVLAEGMPCLASGPYETGMFHPSPHGWVYGVS